MRFKRSMFNLAVIVFAVLSGASAAWAGASIVLTTAPTLSGWLLILLALLFAVVAYRALRGHANSRQR